MIVQHTDKLVNALRAMANTYSLQSDKYRAVAYHKAAENIARMDRIVVEDGKLVTDIPGVGKSISAMLVTFATTGELPVLADAIASNIPLTLFELEAIPGIGANTAQKLWRETGIKSLAEFEHNLDRLKANPKYQRFVDGFLQFQGASKLTPAYVARACVEALLGDWLIHQELLWGFAGSMRRGKESVRDVDVVVITDQRTRFQKQLREYLTSKGIEINVRDGDTKWGMVVGLDRLWYNKTLVVDLNWCTYAEAPTYMSYLTGSRDFNIAMRSRAKTLGYTLNEHGLWKGEIRVPLKDEHGLFKKLGCPYVPPECRVDKTRLGKNYEGLVDLDDLVADLHMHTLESDGSATPKELAHEAYRIGLQIIGISDHSGRTGRGLVDAEKQQSTRLLKRSKFPVRVWAGAEIDTDDEGNLDYSEATIQTLDYFIIANHRKPAYNIEGRLVAAMQAYPSMPKILAHPTNRKIGQRAAVSINWDRVWEVAKRTNTAIEINGQPDRLDLPVEMITRAKAHGLKFALVSDTHSKSFECLVGATKQARRAGLETGDVLNASISMMEKWRSGKIYG